MERMARQDFKKLKDMLKPRDKRRKPLTLKEEHNKFVIRKRYQFDLALHRKGLTSPFDYEYPRFKQMNKMAKVLYLKHLQPLMPLDFLNT